MENLARVLLVPMDYEEKRERIIQEIITYLNYDQVSDTRWHRVNDIERQNKVRKDAEKITDITLEYYKLDLK
jgi:hypothetical protein